MYEFLKNYPQKRVFRNVMFYKEISEQTEPRSAFVRVSEGTNFENFSAWC